MYLCGRCSQSVCHPLDQLTTATLPLYRPRDYCSAQVDRVYSVGQCLRPMYGDPRVDGLVLALRFYMRRRVLGIRAIEFQSLMLPPYLTTQNCIRRDHRPFSLQGF